MEWEDWKSNDCISNNRTCKQPEIQLSVASLNHSSLLLDVQYFPFEQSHSSSFSF